MNKKIFRMLSTIVLRKLERERQIFFQNFHDLSEAKPSDSVRHKPFKRKHKTFIIILINNLLDF